MALDITKLESFVHRVVGDASAAYSAPLVLLGDRLGLYKAMAGAGALTVPEMAAKTGMDERYLREWLCNQAASGYVDYDADTDRFCLSDEQAMVLAMEDSPVFLPGMFEGIPALYKAQPRLQDIVRNGEGMGWHEHDHALFCATERLFRTGYKAHLVSEWIPALDGVQEKLEQGILVADIGCGHGASTIIMAQAFPHSTFIGFDYHEASVDLARLRAEEAGVSDRVSFETATAQSYPGKSYDFVTVFDALHDMGDPVGAARHVRETLTPDGTWLIVEPKAGDNLADNLNPVGRLFYAASTMVCTPNARSQNGGMALGAQAGEARLRDVVTRGGFSHFRRATETPFNLIFEARL